MKQAKKYIYDDKYKYRAPWFIFFTPLISRLRSTSYLLFEEKLQFDSKTTVLDMGVTDSQINYFHKLYPYRDKITAAGLAKKNISLEKTFPEIKYMQVEEKFPYPFKNNEFDIVHSSAVIEHVGNRENQLEFIKELSRIGKRGMISTPNRWYPLEFHTFLPLIHWLPTNVYRKIFTKLGMEIYSQEKNLNLLSYRDVEYLMKKSGVKKYSIIRKRTFGFVSNFLIFWEK